MVHEINAKTATTLENLLAALDIPYAAKLSLAFALNFARSSVGVILFDWRHEMALVDGD